MGLGHVDPRDGAAVYQALGVLVGELGTGADHAAAKPLGQDLGLNNITIREITISTIIEL